MTRLIYLLFGCLALPNVLNAAAIELVVVPDNQPRYAELQRPGTATVDLGRGSGIRWLKVPGDETEYYVLDRWRVMREQVRSSLASIYAFDSDVSIFFGSALGDILHLTLEEGGTGKAVFITSETGLLTQLYEQLADGAGLNAKIRYQRYVFPFDQCAALAENAEDIREALIAGAQGVGRRLPKPEIENITVDGASYFVQARMLDTIAELFISGNSKGLFGPVDSAMHAVRSCIASGVTRHTEHDFGFYSGYASEIL